MRSKWGVVVLAAAAVAACIEGVAHAQDVEQEEVIVRGTAAGDFAARASERESPRELTDAASLVEPLPGVHVRRFGADDSFATLSVRGTSSNEVAVVLAGVPLTGGADPTLDLATLPLWPGAVAHVHRSFAPAALGPGSLGGTLVIDPPKPTSPEVTDAWAAVGSFGEARLRVGDVRRAGDARVATAVSASRADDGFGYFDPVASTPGHDVQASWQNAGHAAANALAAWTLPVRWNDASRGALTVTTLAQARRQELPGTVLGPTPFARLGSSRELASAELTGGAGPGAWTARAWGRTEHTRLTDVAGSAALGPTLAEETIAAAGGSVGWRGWLTPRARVEAHLDGSGERFEPGSTVGAAPPPGATRTSAGIALDADWRARPWLTLAGSGRLDQWRDAVAGGAADDELRPTGHVGVEMPLAAGSLAAHVGTTARPPSFVERYGDRGAFVGDPSLRPESAWTVDAGDRIDFHAGRLHVAGELVAFATWAEDLITFVPTGAYGRAKATNIGRARLIGVEIDTRARYGAFELRAAYTGLTTSNDAACAAVVGSCQNPPLPARPQHDFVADGIVHVGRLGLRAGVDAVTGMFADVGGTELVPPRVLCSLGARFDLVRGVRLAVDLRNVLDERTGTYAGALGPVREPIGDYYEYPLPGRSLLVSVRFTRGDTP